MKKYIIFLTLFAMAIQVFAQPARKRKSRYGYELNVQSPIAYATFVSYNNAQQNPELLINFRLQNDVLSFTRNNGQYKAGYQISVAVRNKETGHVFTTEAWHENVRVNSFEETNAKQTFQFSSRKIPLDLKPGEYEVFVEISDKTTQNVFRNGRTIKIADRTDLKDAHSDIIFLSGLTDLPESAGIHANLEFNKDGYAFFELLNTTPGEYKISAHLIRKKKNSDEDEKEVYQHDYVEETSGKILTFRATLPKKVLKEGRYVLRFNVESGDRQVKLEKPFSVIWFQKPEFLYNWDLAIRPMRYLFDESEWEQIQEKSNDELESWFHAFWEKRDPSKDTPLNEVEKEFFERVDQANDKYSLRFKDGWETDMGKALILYGSPDSVDSKAFNANKRPYEVWYYSNTNKKLIFVDKDNSKDFILVSIENIEDKPGDGKN